MPVTSWRLLDREDPAFATGVATKQRAWVSQLRPLIAEFSKPGDTVFDPFAGWGSTLVAAAVEGRKGIGVEIAEDRVAAAKERLAGYPDQTMLVGDARKPAVPDESVDLVLCDLPYFGTDPSASSGDDGTFYALQEYDNYLEALAEAFGHIARVLRPGGHAVICVHNRRVAGKFVPLAWDSARVLGRYLELGDERIHLYPRTGTGDDPTVTNKAHEYVLVGTKLTGTA